MSEQRYEQGMARPEIDIGTSRAARKPVAQRTTLVTGGAGFIGGHLVRQLLDTGRQVVVLDVRGFTPESRFVIGPEEADSLTLELASIGDQARVLDVFRTHRPDEVVHAGMILDPAYLATNRTTAFTTNVGGVVNLVEAMIAFGVPRLVNFSSIGVLPRVVYRPIDANHPLVLADGGPGTDFYGSTKAAAEVLLFAYNQALGFDFRTIRPSAVYGLGMNQYVGPIKAMVESSVRGESAHFEFGGSHPRAYTHAIDVAGLVVAMLDAPDDADRIFYGSAGGPMTTTTEVAEIVRGLLPGADVEIGEELSEAEKPVAALRAELSIENAWTQLGWEPRFGSIREGIAHYVETYREFYESTRTTS
jgi:UDP-glucose 4-epimerase